MLILAGGVCVAAMLFCGCLILWYFRYSPRVWEHPVHDVLILAAHQDDCAIMAGEYAIQAAGCGKRVDILYLTNGDSANVSPDSPRAKTRERESRVAWQGIASSIASLSLPAAPIPGPLRMRPHQLEAAKHQIVQAICSLPSGAAVFIPAAREDHVDHRALRSVSLEALGESSRTDLVICEAPEYNSHISLARTPCRGFIYLAEALPILRRLATSIRHRRLPPTGFPSGERPYILPPDTERLRKKQRMLATFESEGGDRLVRLFGNPDQFRVVRDLRAASLEQPSFFVSLGTRKLGISTVTALCTLCAIAFCLGVVLIVGLLRAPLPSLARAAAFLAATVGSLIVLRRFQEPRQLRLLYFSALAGLVFGATMVLHQW